MVSIKNEDSSVNHLPQCNPLYQEEAHLLWKLMTKGEKLDKDIKMHHGGEVEVGHGHGQRGSNIKEWRRIKIFGQEKHKSRGSKLMNLVVCICFVYIHVLACIA